MTALARRLTPAAAAPFTLPSAAVLLVPFILLGVLGARAPFYALAAAVGVVFVLITFRNLAAGVALFTVTTFFQHLPGTGTGSSIEVTGVKAAGAVLALAWIVMLMRRRDVPFLLNDQPLIGFSLIAFQIWTLATALWAEDPGVAVSSSLRYGQNIVLFFIVYSALQEARHYRWLVIAFGGTALVSLLIALASGPQETAAPVTALHSNRLTGRYGAGDPNWFAALLLPALIFCLFWLVVERRRAARVALLALASLFIVGIFMTESRGGLVALAAAGLFACFVAGRWRTRAVLATALAVVVCVAYFGVIASPESRARVTRLNAQGSSGRNDLWRVGVAMAADHPILGVGAGNFTLVSPRYAARPPDIVNVDYVVDTPKVTHNTYLNIVDDLGIPGLLFFGLIIGGTFGAASAGIRALARVGDVEMEVLARAVVLGSLGMLAAAFFFSGEYQKQLWLLLGASAALPSVANRMSSRVRKPAPVASGAVVSSGND